MDTLTIRREPGAAPAILGPIPRLAVVSLSALMAATVREWVQVLDEDPVVVLAICGHRFIPVAWVELSPGGLLVEHTCCPEGL